MVFLMPPNVEFRLPAQHNLSYTSASIYKATAACCSKVTLNNPSIASDDIMWHILIWKL